MKRRFWSPRNTSPSISCGLAEPLLSLYSDSMASPGEQRLVESHLSACEDCRRALEWMQVTQGIISGRPAALPPSDLKARIARQIAASEPPLTIRTVRRPMILRPALLATAASLIVAGVLFEHPLLTAPKQSAVARPRHVAELPAPAPNTGLPAVTPPPPAGHPSAAPRLAAATPRVTSQRPVPKAVLSATRVAAQPQPAPDAAPAVGAPRTADLQPRLTAAPLKPPRVAKGTQSQPQNIPPRTNGVVVATRSPDAVTDTPANGSLVASLPEPAQQPQVAEVVRPDVTRVAVTTPAVTRPAREDALSSVRPRLASLNAGYPRKIARSDVAHVQATAYNSSSNFPAIIATSYTPGLNDKPETPRGRGTEQTTPH